MKEVEDLPIIERPNEKDRKIIDYLNECIAKYVEENETERRELIGALFVACQIVFCHQTNFKLKKQCREIDEFCKYLKESAAAIDKETLQ